MHCLSFLSYSSQGWCSFSAPGSYYSCPRDGAGGSWRMLVTLGAGSVCGAFWILLIDTAVNPAIPDAMNEPAVLVVGVVTALVAASLLSMANHLSRMVGLSAMAMGFHSLSLPIAALISIVAGGAHAVALRAVALSIGGLLVGVVLVIVGDRVLRRRRMRSSKARFDLGRPPA